MKPPKSGAQDYQRKKNTLYLKMCLGLKQAYIQIQFLHFPAVRPQANDSTFQKVAQFLKGGVDNGNGIYVKWSVRLRKLRATSWISDVVINCCTPEAFFQASPPWVPCACCVTTGPMLIFPPLPLQSLLGWFIPHPSMLQFPDLSELEILWD